MKCIDEEGPFQEITLFLGPCYQKVWKKSLPTAFYIYILDL